MLAVSPILRRLARAVRVLTPIGRCVPEPDPAPHFAPLFELLATAVDARDLSNPRIGDLLASGAVAARSAGVRPETMLAYLRRRVTASPLSSVGDWYRGVLAERIVAGAVSAYFAPTDRG